LDSETTGFVIRAAVGSIAGTLGTSTSPPPRRRIGDRIRDTVVGWSSMSVMVASVVGAESCSSGGRKIA
jgi:hypothetical protein